MIFTEHPTITEINKLIRRFDYETTTDLYLYNYRIITFYE